LHVESVVWISERKDVLSTALWLATLLAYLHWVAHPGRLRYALVTILTALALLAKPMAVTLPFTLLLLDFWPLRRWPARSWRSLVWEKLPLLALAVVISVITLRVQRGEGATDFGTSLTLPMRLANAVVSCARYLARTFRPEPLSPFHPHPGWWPWGIVLGAAVLIAAVSWLAWSERARRPWLLFGWAWFLGTLVPVLGLVQVGAQSIADRYTYVPLLGLFTIAAWAGAEFLARPLRLGLATAALAACVFTTILAIPPWRDPLSLAAHMRAAIGEHFIVQRELGTALQILGRPQAEIEAAWQRGRELAPDYPYFLNELGVSAGRAGRFDEARVLLEKVRDLVPEHPDAHVSLAGLEFVTGRTDAAIAALRQAIALRPQHAPAHRLLAQILVKARRFSEARDALRAAVRADRWDWIAWNELGVVLNHLGHTSEARECFERAHWINPRDENVVANLKALRKPAR
jgi:Flp pilus assembly protein TadD